jgi:hypothetical protein
LARRKAKEMLQIFLDKGTPLRVPECKYFHATGVPSKYYSSHKVVLLEFTNEKQRRSVRDATDIQIYTPHHLTQSPTHFSILIFEFLSVKSDLMGSFYVLQSRRPSE